jgi:hypothetical protein
MILKLTVDRFEGKEAVLKTEDNKTIIWPQAKLPSGIKEGSNLQFTIADDEKSESHNRELAKDILNEILAPDN